MKKTFFLIAILAVTSFSFVRAQDLSMGICPMPQEVNLSEQNYVPYAHVTIACGEKDAADWAARHLKEWYAECAPEVKAVRYKGGADGAEAYTISIDAKEVKVQAATLQGVRYALYSLRQIAIPARGTQTIQGWIVPCGTIKDQPDIAFRGMHISWFIEMAPWEAERLIRLSAYYKLNYVIIEPWGSFKSEVAPWCNWPDAPLTIDEAHRLTALAKDLGVTLIPQINMFGHATSSSVGNGKHAVLDFGPQYQPLFEPDEGWNWCLTNPETRKLLIARMEEMHEAFGNPPYFHIGCDEASAPSCPNCKARPYGEIVVEHLKAMNDAISKRGAHAMMWHDMLLRWGDPRWSGFVANGSEETANMVKDMPKDIVICDWYYGDVKESYPSLAYFKEQGFPVLSCPWNNRAGIVAQGKQVQQLGLDGILGTLWNTYFGPTLSAIFTNTANVAWNPDVATPGMYRSSLFKTHLRQIGWDMHVDDYERTGWIDYQIEPQTTQYR